MLQKAQMVMRKALKTFQSGRMTVIVRRSEKDPRTKVQRMTESRVLEDVPCRLSFRAAETQGSDFQSSATATMTLFVDPGTEIPEGSKIVVDQEGKTFELERSSVPQVYATHREYEVALFKGWL